jgi:RNA polymerase sigma-70 factor (ECF subfamily)
VHPKTLVCAQAHEEPEPMPSVPTVEGLYRIWADVVARWAYRLGGPGIDVDDIVQQVFLKVHGKLGSLKEATSARSWLFCITQNEIRQQRRRERLKRMFGLVRPLDEEVSDANPHADLERKQAARQVYALLDHLPEKYREVLILFQLEEMSGEEIAELTGAKVGTVWVWIYRARAQFLKQMQKMEGERP